MRKQSSNRPEGDALDIPADEQTAARAPTAEFSYDAPADGVVLADLRERFRRWCDAEGHEQGQWPMILTELARNAVDASPSDAPIEVTVVVGDGAVTAVVSDRGPGFAVDASVVMPRPSSSRGRGLPIIEALSDRLGVFRHGGTTSVVVSILHAAGDPRTP